MINRLLLVGLFLILVLEPMQVVRLGLLPGLSYKNLVLYLLVAVLGVRAAFSPRGLELRDLDVHFAFLALIFYAFVTWALSTAFDPTYNSFRSLIALKGQFVDYYLILLIFRYGVGSLEETLSLLRTFVAVLLLTSLVVLVDYFALGGMLFGIHKGRVQGIVREPNEYAALLVFLLPVAIASISTIFRRRWFWWTLVAITAFLLLATGSRGAYVSLLIGPFLAAWYLRRWVDFFTVARVWFLAIGGVMIMLLVAVFVLQSEFIIDRLARLWESLADIGTLAVGNELDDASRLDDESRILIWSAFFRAMMEWPLSFLVGYGWNSYSQFAFWKSAHSEYVDMLFQLGLIGLTAYVALFAVLIGRTRAALSAMPPPLRRLLIGYIFGFVPLMMAVAFVKVASIWPLIFVFVGLMMGIQARGREASAAAARQPADQPARPEAGEPPPLPPSAAGPGWISSRTPSSRRID